jgi:hypothetical protein
MGRIIGSRRGKPLLPLSVNRVLFAMSIAASFITIYWWARGDADAYSHEHSRLAMTAFALTLLAASGLARQNRRLHVGLFASGAVCLVISIFLR